jgi:uncharacterized membrane protein
MRAETLHALLLLSIIVGLGFALFAYAESVDPALRTACSVDAFFSCSKIDTSGMTTTLGIQDYSWGIAGFVILLAFDVPLFRTWRRDLLTAVLGVSAIGVALSLYLGYLELVVIQGLCPICLGAYLSNAVAFGCAFALWWIGRGSAGTKAAPPADASSA